MVSRDKGYNYDHMVNGWWCSMCRGKRKKTLVSLNLHTLHNKISPKYGHDQLF